MTRLFLGIDMAGEAATSVTALTETAGGLSFYIRPRSFSLEEIFHLCESSSPLVVAAAIDAPLTGSVSDRRGFRSSDLELQEMLPPSFRCWVQSANSLMAVAVRGRLLAEAISPLVGTILETHPRACLAFAAKADDEIKAVDGYKRQIGGQHVQTLWERWSKLFSISGSPPEGHDALDATVCSTIGYLYHRRPSMLRHLTHAAAHRQGRGPFIVLEPEAIRSETVA